MQRPALAACEDLGTAQRLWQRLNEDGSADDVHQVCAGFRAWACTDPLARPLPLLVAYENEQPVALLPVCHRGRRVRGLNVRILESAGNDHWRMGMPVLGSDAPASMAALLQGLRRLRGWDMLEIGPMLESSQTATMLLSESQRLGLRPQVAWRMDDPVVQLEGAFEAYYAGRSANLRSQVKRGEARLAGEGHVSFEEYTGGPDLGQRLEEFYGIEASGWKGREGTAIASLPHVREFYTILAREAAARGSLRLHLLRVNGQCIAADFCLAFRGSVHMLKVGYDEAWSRCSPGQVIRKRVLEHLFHCGVESIYDLMPGGGDHRAYKMRWANAIRPCVTFRLFNPRSARGRLIATASLVRSWFRKTSPPEAAEAELEAEQTPA